MIDPVEVLRHHPYFTDVSAAALEAVGRRTIVHRYERNTLLFVEGEPPPGLYLVAEGSVRLFKASPQGREQDLFHAQPGETFNNAAAFDGAPTFANAQVVEPAVLLLIPRAALQELVRQYPELGLAAARVLASRLREVAHLAGDLSLRQTLARLAGVLLRLSDGATTFTLPVHRELAATIGTVREVVTRGLRECEQRGVLALGPRRSVTILDRAALERLSGPSWPGVV